MRTHVHICEVCVHPCAGMCASGGQKSTVSVVLSHSLPYLVGEGLSWNLELTDLDWLASISRDSPVSTSSVLGFQVCTITPGSLYAWQACYLRNHLPAPISLFLLTTLKLDITSFTLQTRTFIGIGVNPACQSSLCLIGCPELLM